MQVGENGSECLHVLLHPFRAEPCARRVVEEVVCNLLLDSSRIKVVHGRLIVRPDQRLVPLDIVRHRSPTPERLIQQGYAEQRASARGATGCISSLQDTFHSPPLANPEAAWRIQLPISGTTFAPLLKANLQDVVRFTGLSRRQARPAHARLGPLHAVH
jgi:hypothetical protein